MSDLPENCQRQLQLLYEELAKMEREAERARQEREELKAEMEREAERARQEMEVLARQLARLREKNEKLARPSGQVPPEEPLDDVKEQSLSRYEAIGSDLNKHEDKNLVALKGRIRQCRSYGIPRPFIVIDGSSGEGKTQCAFSLGSDQAVIYLLLTDIGERDQRIYRCFEALSNCLVKSIETDVARFVGEDCVTTELLQDQTLPFLTTGIILNICKFLRDNGPRPSSLARRTIPLDFTSLTVGEFQREMIPFWNWVIVWDETPAEVKRTSFARSLSRLAGLITIMMGTESTANIIRQRGSASRGGGMIPWSFIFTDLPLASYDLIVRHCFEDNDPLQRLPPSLGNILRGLLQQSRPWIISLTLECTNELVDEAHPTGDGGVNFLQTLLERVGSKICSHKTALNDDFQKEFMLGQLTMMLPHYAEGNIDNIIVKYAKSETHLGDLLRRESVFVRHHFAVPKCSSLEVYHEGKDLLVDEYGKPWVVFSYYRQREALLWFALGTINHTFSPDCTVRQILADSQGRIRLDPVLHHTNSVKPDGSYMESLGVCAALRASQHALTGVGVDDFVKQVLRECNLLTLTALSDLCRGIRDLRIPYFLPPSTPASSINLESSGAIVADLVRPKDQAQVDGLSDILLVECKDHAQPLDKSHMEGIVKRMCGYPARLALVYVNTCQDTYYSTSTRPTQAGSQEPAPQKKEQDRHLTFDAFRAGLSADERQRLDQTALIRLAYSDSQECRHFEPLLSNWRVSDSHVNVILFIPLGDAPPKAASA